MSGRGLDPEVVEGLRKSFRVLRPVYPIVKSKRTGRIIDGLHRYEASPATYEKYCVELDMDEKQEILYRIHLNYRRDVTKKERQEQLTKLAEILEKEGVKREEMVSELAKLTPFTERWIRELLPDKYKMVEKARETEAAEVTSAKPKPEVRVYEPWEYRKARMTQPVSRMDEAVAVELQRLGIPFEFQREFCVQSTTPDIYLPDRRTAIYLDGEEAHAGREERDEALRELLSKRHGVKVVSIPYKQYSESELKRIVEIITKEAGGANGI